MDIPDPSPATRSLTSQAFERLRTEILAGALAPGERLRILTLSEHYGFGTTAIREALSRLVADGLVDSEDMRGFRVTPVSREELLDLTGTRIEFESMALRQAIAAGDLEWEAELAGAFHRVSHATPEGSPQQRAQWSRAHRAFHRALIAGCNSPWKIRLWALLYDKSERYRSLAVHHQAPASRDTVDEHRRLMEAAMARDADLACALLADHFRATADTILRACFDDAAAAGTPATARRHRRQPASTD